MNRKSSKCVLGTRVTLRLPTSLYRALSEKANACHQSMSTAIRTQILEKLTVSSDGKEARKEYEVLMEMVYLLRALMQKIEPGLLPKARYYASEKGKAIEDEKALNSNAKEKHDVSIDD